MTYTLLEVFIMMLVTGVIWGALGIALGMAIIIGIERDTHK